MHNYHSLLRQLAAQEKAFSKTHNKSTQ